MYQITAQQTIPQQCQGDPLSRITFRDGNLKLTLPSALELKAITYYMQRGMSLVDAYTNANARYIIPDAAMRSCISQVLTTEYYDTGSGQMKVSGGQFTCIGFHNCFQDYVAGQGAFPEAHPADRRLLIAEGVYSPSWNEEECIKGKLLMQVPLDEAYEDCGASDVLPDWPGALGFIQRAFMKSIGDNVPLPPLYDITKRSYQLYAIQPLPPAVTPPPILPAITPPAKKDSKTLLYLVAGGLALVMISRG